MSNEIADTQSDSLVCGRSKLTLIISSVEVARGLGNEAVSAKVPLFATGDAHCLACSTRTRVGAGQNPVVSGLDAVHDHPIKRHDQIGKSGHEALRCVGYRCPDYGRWAVVDLNEPASEKKDATPAAL